MSQGRDGFTSTFGALMATLGSAVGLGNIWKFPSLTGSNGGAGFLLVYLAATLLVGLPVMISETMLGRSARANAVTSFERLAPKNQGGWKIIGWMGFAAAFLIMAFYSEVAGWVYAYIFKSLTGEIATTDPQAAAVVFGQLVSSPVLSLFWQWVVLALTGFIIAFGVSKGIEAVTRRLMPLLFVLLLILCVRSLTLSGAEQGLDFLFHPDFAQGDAGGDADRPRARLLQAVARHGHDADLRQLFPRRPEHQPPRRRGVMFADLSVSLLAGIAIFPAVFAFGFQPAAGPSLVFMTIPAVFTSMPGGIVFMTLFFILTAIASVGAILSLLEVPVAVLSERFHMTRKAAAITTIAITAVLGLPAALSQGVTADLKIFGLNPFDLFDFLSSNILLPLGGILICIFVGWVYGLAAPEKRLATEGTPTQRLAIRGVFFMVRYVAPIAIAIVLLNGLKLF